LFHAGDCRAAAPLAMTRGANRHCERVYERGNLKLKTTNKARRTKNKPFWSFSISFEEAKQYRRKFLNVLTRESQWEEIIVDVYL